MKKFALVGCLSSKNWYSFAPLFANLERFNIFQKYTPFLIKKRTESALQPLINQFERIILAYSFYTHETPTILQELNQIKSQFPREKIKFIAGGPHASGNPQQTIRMGFDLVIKGEGECSFPLLLERLWNDTSYSDIPGVCYSTGNSIHESTPINFIDLDETPTFSEKFHLYPPLEISRGCPFGCKYCQVSYLFGRTMRHRRIETILKIVKVYQKIFMGRRSLDIRFISPNSLAYFSKDGRSPNPKKIIQLLKSIYELAKDNIRIFFASFPSETRPEFISLSLLEHIAPFLSNDHIAFGAQSGSDRILQLINRQHTVQDIQNATEAVLDSGFIPLIDFILGLPGEHPQDQFQTLTLIKELINQKARVRIHYFMPLAGTPFANASSAPIAPTILSELGRFAKKGKIEGNLNTQIQNSYQIQTFFHNL
ncbi:MAG: TIGR04013 family B12-binding domain/radical SAM domain-containing protein [Candidatus Helarchaeota archaeon]